MRRFLRLVSSSADRELGYLHTSDGHVPKSIVRECVELAVLAAQLSVQERRDLLLLAASSVRAASRRSNALPDAARPVSAF